MSTFGVFSNWIRSFGRILPSGVNSGGGDIVGGNVVAGDQYITNLSATPLRPPRQLPTTAGDFVGRTFEVSEITRAIRAGKAVGIFGLGGVGKTELAKAIANQLVAEFPDAQLFIDLRGGSAKPRDPQEALFSALHAFQAIPPGTNPFELNLRDLYLTALGGKRALVLLDDCFDLKQVRDLVPPATCALIISARMPIPVPGLIPVQLQELPRSECIELFSSIAVNVKTELAVQICEICGCLPLAIRACATRLAYTPDLDPEEYLAQLRNEKQRLALFANADSGIDVETALDSSFRRLTKKEAEVFKNLPAFPGTWDAAAEEYVCQDTSHKGLTQLVKLSLVHFDKSNRRYRMHDLVRLYAMKLQQGGPEGANERHSEYFAMLLSEAVPPGRVRYDLDSKAYNRCKQEWGNIQKGQSWAAANIDRSKKAAPMSVIYAMTQTAFFLDMLIPPREQIRWNEDALKGARKLRNVEMQCNFLTGLGAAYGFVRDDNASEGRLQEALSLSRANRLRKCEGLALQILAGRRVLKGRTSEALPLAEKSLEILTSLHLPEAAEVADLVQDLRRNGAS